MIERFHERWCKRFHQRCHRHIGCSVICGACGRIWLTQDFRSIAVPTPPYRPTLWLSGEMIAHIGPDQMERFLESEWAPWLRS